MREARAMCDPIQSARNASHVSRLGTMFKKSPSKSPSKENKKGKQAENIEEKKSIRLKRPKMHLDWRSLNQKIKFRKSKRRASEDHAPKATEEVAASALPQASLVSSGTEVSKIEVMQMLAAKMGNANEDVKGDTRSVCSSISDSTGSLGDEIELMSKMQLMHLLTEGKRKRPDRLARVKEVAEKRPEHSGSDSVQSGLSRRSTSDFSVRSGFSVRSVTKGVKGMFKKLIGKKQTAEVVNESLLDPKCSSLKQDIKKHGSLIDVTSDWSDRSTEAVWEPHEFIVFVPIMHHSKRVAL
jgi:hypothetical protein